MKKKTILYITSRNARDKRTWSGTMYYMGQSLQIYAGEVVYAGPYEPRFLLFYLKGIRKLTHWIFGKKFLIPYSILLTYCYKYYFNQKIKKYNPDIIFAGSSVPEISRINAKCPIINLNDITFELLIDRYENFTNLTRFSIRKGEYVEKMSYANSEVLIFSSQWAANSAYNHYNIPKEKVRVISFGANIDKIPGREEIFAKDTDSFNILFLGVDWIRKGGNIVYDCYKHLKHNNQNVTLTIIGCDPPVDKDDTDLTIIPFLNKNKPDDFEKLYHIMLKMHVLFVPSRFDCTPIAFCEASAFGLPVLSTDVGGIASVVVNNVNGFTLPLDSGKIEFSEIISKFIADTDYYKKMAISSRDYYESNLSWEQWGKKLNEIMDELLLRSRL